MVPLTAKSGRKETIMCQLCDESPDGIVSCQDCGRLICFDTKAVDDICAPAYVTASGDLFCQPCGSRYDQEEEEEVDEWLGMWGDYPGELLAGTIAFDEAMAASGETRP
jgi:hypothetical protein